VSKLAAGSRKRKLSDASKPESVKRVKSEGLLSTPVPPNPTLSTPKLPARVTVEDANDEEDEARNGAEDEQSELSEEDEDGRFFGGGLTSQQRDILNIFDGAGGEGAVQDVSSQPPPRQYDIYALEKPSAHSKARAVHRSRRYHYLASGGRCSGSNVPLTKTRTSGRSTPMTRPSLSTRRRIWTSLSRR